MSPEELEKTAAEIELLMLKNCEEEGLLPTQNLPKIAKAKARFFGKDNWRRCPCDAQNDARFCTSTKCWEDIREKGVCHCNCYKPK